MLIHWCRGLCCGDGGQTYTARSKADAVDAADRFALAVQLTTGVKAACLHFELHSLSFSPYIIAFIYNNAVRLSVGFRC